MAKKWYIVHTQTGYEDRVKTNLENRLKASLINEQISQILIPTEKVSEIRDGKKKISERKVFPGYVFIEMELTEESWYLVRNTQGITGFIGPGSRPQALKESEIDNIIRQSEEKKERPIPKIAFDIGESVRIKEGPFTNFNGTIEEVNPVKQKLKAKVSIFGRLTPVELEYWQVEKL
ncbi:MAG: transcription termination/antitermination protein NusG [Candidatus Omnitrophica bacterium CG12_big_fil_rev_8_21_14_0_65_43_15]|uniref:Transcription termination/antitermination protein NusG n=1 Tax=Candidatus Taenaricola geysiri TaxID=1974752 RepID=A0A2J0LME9_9BACT|nr:MAG: transcription termination/antitermination protein NusG [Candidatus Omnitrophica bacterium CG1_02_43_210]PIR65757.1 MAG: transcription termination/antitermination protein NusG [Candidatus Omnitrophica bacterium CG10_big_fil_rev_8_21_14_0_10_43_8]PIV11782.1 MAG: transcription termination/antitermination protein NusG [Candidatus Omnitrophica bacterium CG03_land_8_20_14_0_80_43_22]PIW65876.1 MAG: transcription termination/antitermination protein NusG [Candidatus Omnitrophica bacterium CG12_b